MDNTTTIALSRLIAQQNAMDVRATNIANMNTPGFRALHMGFSEYLLAQTGAATASGGNVLSYTQGAATWRDDTQGQVTSTGNPLDLAITSGGYFQVQTANGIRLTRAGHFQLAADGTITDMNGNALLDNAGQTIKLGANDVNPQIMGDGSVVTANGAIGRIGVVTANNPSQLTNEGNSLLVPNGGTTALDTPKVLQGAIEQSNVEPIGETTAMMNDLREFQFVTQMLDAENQRQQNAIDKLTSTSNAA